MFTDLKDDTEKEYQEAIEKWKDKYGLNISVETIGIDSTAGYFSLLISLEKDTKKVYYQHSCLLSDYSDLIPMVEKEDKEGVYTYIKEEIPMYEILFTMLELLDPGYRKQSIEAFFDSNDFSSVGPYGFNAYSLSMEFYHDFMELFDNLENAEKCLKDFMAIFN